LIPSSHEINCRTGLWESQIATTPVEPPFATVSRFMSFHGGFERFSRWVPTVDVLVCAVVLLSGALQLALPLRSDDFFMGDTIYVELATSLLENGKYGVDYNDVQYPPGLPFVLALVCKLWSCSYVTLVRTMSIFLALGLLASYWLLKRVEGTAAAATACLLIASSPIAFAFSTHGVSSDTPYFFFSMVTLTLFTMMDRISNSSGRTLRLGVLCSAGLVASLLIRSSGVALVAGLGGWLTVGSLWTDKATRMCRMRRFSGVMLAGILAQVLWMTWASKHQTVEWPSLEGHPRTYLSQLIVKDGLHPELGTASAADVIARVPQNVVNRATGLVQLLTRKDYIEAAWYSPLVFGALLLIAIGLGASLRREGGSPMEWYFLSHEAMYAVWPWPFEVRFLLPVAPLACIYAWRGGKAIGWTISHRPRAVGAAGTIIGLLACTAASAAAWNSAALQPRIAATFWAVIALASLWIIFPKRFETVRLPTRIVLGRLNALAGWGKRLNLPRAAGWSILTGLVVSGLVLQLKIGKQNLMFDVAKSPSYGSIAAARWIAENAADDAVVMARQLDVVHHYAHRKVVWFPPISDPQVLLQGIRRLDANYIVVTKTWTYYQPSDVECIDALLSEYQGRFQIAKEDARFRIIKVVRE
jgi:hypothetical protein